MSDILGTNEVSFNDMDLNGTKNFGELDDDPETTELQPALSFDSDSEQVKDAVNIIENDSLPPTDSMGESELVSPNLSMTTVETSSDFGPAASFDSEDTRPDSPDLNKSESEPEKTEEKSSTPTTKTTSSSQVVTQLWVHRNADPESESVSVDRDVSASSNPNAANEDSDEVTSDFSNQLSPLQENSESASLIDGGKIDEDVLRPSEPEPLQDLRSEPLNFDNIGSSEDLTNINTELEPLHVEVEVEISPVAAERSESVADPASARVEESVSDAIQSSTSRLDLIWDTDIPSESDHGHRHGRALAGTAKESSQHSLEGPGPSGSNPQNDGNQVGNQGNAQLVSPYTSEIESLTIFNKTELNPLPRRPVNSFGGTFKDGGDDSLVETTWDSESVASQKDIPNIPADPEPEKVKFKDEVTPINENAPFEMCSVNQASGHKNPGPNLESKLQISISTDVMDCTIQADNLPVKQNKVSQPVNSGNTENHKTKQSEPINVTQTGVDPQTEPRLTVNKNPVQRTPVGSPNTETGQKDEFSTQPKPRNIWADELRSDIYKKEPRSQVTGRPKRLSSKTKVDQPNEELSSATKEHMSKLCSQHDHQELHLCCMPPAPSYNFTPRIEQVGKHLKKKHQK